jgi:hypothetical protein
MIPGHAQLFEATMDAIELAEGSDVVRFPPMKRTVNILCRQLFLRV